MHEAVPEAMISCNPCCWKPETPHFEADELIYPLMADWYDKAIAISLPAVSLLDHPRSGALFRAPRKYNAHYEVVTQRAKSEAYENVNYPRMLVWKSIVEGFNGWNLFCYHNPPGYEIWDDMDLPDAGIALAYPGPNGPVPTRQFEAAREGYEDYMLMALLKQRSSQQHAEVLAACRAGRSYVELRDMVYGALEAARPARAGVS